MVVNISKLKSTWLRNKSSEAIHDTLLKQDLNTKDTPQPSGASPHPYTRWGLPDS